MKVFSQDRSILSQLVAGGLSILVFFALSWLLADVYLLHQLDRANNRRWAASSIALNLQQARGYEGEGDFMVLGDFQQRFYETGDSPQLAQHRMAVEQMRKAIDSLALWLDDDQQSIEQNLRNEVKQYTTSFDELVNAYQKRGYGQYGVEGQWRAVVDTIQELTHNAGESIAIYADHLIGAQRDFLLDRDAKSSATMTTATAELARSGGGLPRLLTMVHRCDSLFGRYRDLQASIGLTERDGLQGQLLASASAVQHEVDTVLSDAVRDNETVRRRIAVIIPTILVIELGLAILFFFGFANSISRATRQLGDAAVAIGKGQFDVRVNTSGNNELSQLAQAFNRMAENLGALITSVRQAGTQINASTSEIAATARQQQATASEIAATTSEVSSTAREISATSQDLASSMKHVAEIAEQTTNLAGSGQSGISKMEATMRQITEAAESISTKLAALAEKAGNITTVVTTITKVADQTNLLSLNAAIEAEKAGEAGRGFAVVATEIRRLADQTAIATSDIEGIVKEMQSAVTAGVMGMDKFSDEIRRGVNTGSQVGTQLTEILNQVQTLTPNFEMVNQGMQSQAEAAQQISLALSQLGTAAQQTVESLVQSNRIIEQLNEASRGLQAGVSRFTVAI
jgi:methyl-accepting chemotaxis protein